MTLIGTFIKIVDNTGARFAQVIRVLKKSPRARARLGDTVIGVVKIATPHKRIGKHEICKCLIIRDPLPLVRLDGSRIKFNQACGIILKKDRLPMGTKIHGPVYKEFREKGYLRVVSLSTIAL